MRRKLLGRLVSLGFVAGSVLILMGSEAQSQVGRNRLPSPRPKIFLNNNGSLLTTANPNFGLPSQLPFMFIAYTHEDCRLFVNGASIIPQFRLLAAECDNIQINNGSGPGGVVVNPGLPSGAIGICYDPGFVGQPVYPVIGPIPPGGVSSAVCIDIRPFGANYGRNPRAFGGPRPGYGGYPGYLPYPGYAYPTASSGNYSSYNPGASGSSLTTMEVGASTAFRGFDLVDGKTPEFMASVGTAPRTKFGTGFGLKYSTCGGCGDTDLPKREAEKTDPVSEAQE